jgi:hypothetical protein
MGIGNNNIAIKLTNHLFLVIYVYYWLNLCIFCSWVGRECVWDYLWVQLISAHVFQKKSDHVWLRQIEITHEYEGVGSTSRKTVPTSTHALPDYPMGRGLCPVKYLCDRRNLCTPPIITYVIRFWISIVAISSAVLNCSHSSLVREMKIYNFSRT